MEDNRYASPSFLVKPPRHVPLLVRLRLLTGGFMNQFGWFFFGFGMIFVWVFGLNCDPMAVFVFNGKLQTAEGQVVNTVETNMSEGGGEHSDGTPIYMYCYEFEHNGIGFSGESYSVGNKLKTGDQVTIEFPPNRPERSRIQGMRTAAFSAIVLLVLIFPVVGVCFVVAGLLLGLKACKLLRIGEFTTGKLVSTESTNTEINNQRVFKLKFEFQDEAGKTHEAIAKTHQTENLQDDEHEPLLYDPVFPRRATLLDHLPGAPAFDDDGRIVSSDGVSTLIFAIIPAVSIVGHSIAFYLLILK